MGQIISNFPVLIISDPCHPWEPGWYSISCVSCWFTELCSCYFPYWVFLKKHKYKSECTFPSDGTTCQWLSRLAREILSPATSLLAVIEMGLARELIIIKQDNNQYVTAILLRESLKFLIQNKFWPVAFHCKGTDVPIWAFYAMEIGIFLSLRS